MKRTALLAALAVCAALAACGGKQTPPKTPDPLPAVADAPYELADDRDLADTRARYDALDVGDPARSAMRDELAAEYARRIDAALAEPDESRYRTGYETLRELAGLWDPGELNDAASLRASLSPYAPQMRAIRRVFARSGGDVEVTLALVMLAAIAPDGDTAAQDELNELLAFADDLARAQFDEGAVRARPINLLDETAQAFPTRNVVDRLLTLCVERQRAVHEYIRKYGATVPLIRAHGESLRDTGWRIARVLARAGRLDEAPKVLDAIRGIGDDEALRKRLARAFGDDDTPEAWIALAQSFTSGEDTTDHAAVLAVAREGLNRWPKSGALWGVAANAAQEMDNTHLAIDLYERGLEVAPEDRKLAAPLAELYRLRVVTLASSERPRAAQDQLAVLEAFHAQAERIWPDDKLPTDLAEAYAAMGRGMVSLGMLDEARAYLEQSMSLRPTLDALEYLGTIALKKDRHAKAIEYFDRAIALPTPDVGAQFERARVLRLAGDARAAAGDAAGAADKWRTAVDAWLAIVNRWEVPARFKAEILIESGKAQWALGDRDTAMRAFEAAIDTDPDGADTHAAVVAFLIVRDEYEGALDAYHRALGSYGISAYFKVYMSLWVLAEARRTGIAADPLATEYLGSRQGRLWYDDLARFASGKSSLEAIKTRADTRGRRAEMLYYAAVLTRADDGNRASEIRTLLGDVVATDMVLFFEYDMAKHWLAQGFGDAARSRAEAKP